jgi:hypothetical protein
VIDGCDALPLADDESHFLATIRIEINNVGGAVQIVHTERSLLFILVDAT